MQLRVPVSAAPHQRIVALIKNSDINGVGCWSADMASGSVVIAVVTDKNARNRKIKTEKPKMNKVPIAIPLYCNP